MKISILNSKTLSTLALGLALLLSACSKSGEQTSAQKTEVQASSATSNSQAANNKKNFADAPDFTLTRMNGDPFTLSNHKGQVVVLNVWATWCPPCRKEIPGFIDIQKQMRDKGVLFVGVSVDKKGWKVVRPFAKKLGINYPIVVDDGTINLKYGPFRGIPTTFIINKKGKVEYMTTGLINQKALQPVLDKLASR